MTHDYNGQPSTDNPVLSSEIGYARVNLTADTYEPGVYYIADATADSGYALEAADAEFDPNQAYYMQYEKASINSLNEYFSHITTLARINPAKYTRLPLDENLFEINANTRTITVPSDFSKNGVSVQGDEIAEIIYFKINRYFDMDDLSTKQVFIEWSLPSGRTGLSKVWSAMDVQTYPGYIIFGWPIDSAVTETPGDIQFTVRFYTADEDNGNMLLYSWSTLPCKVSIKPTLNFDISDMLEANDADIIRNNDDLILNRLQDSIIDELDTQAEEPIFFDRDEVDGEPTNFGDLPEKFDMADGVTNILYSSAYAPDGGTVNYRWIKNSWAPTKYNEIVLTEDSYKAGTYYIADPNNAGKYIMESADSVFDSAQKYYSARYGIQPIASQEITKEQTLDTSREANKTYYYETTPDDTSIKTYSIYGGTIEAGGNGKGVIGDFEYGELYGEPVYETVTKAVIDGIGRYKVVATNRANKSTASKTSTICLVMPPNAPVISKPVLATGYLTEENNYSLLYDGTSGLFVTIDKNDRNEVATYQWLRRMPEGTEFEEIAGATSNSYNVLGAAYNSGEDLGDGFYKVIISNTLNGDTVSIESTQMIVTHMPEKPVVSNKEDLTGPDKRVDVSLAEARTNGLTFELGAFAAEEETMKQAITAATGEFNGPTFKWYRVYDPNHKAEDFDTLADKAYNGEYEPDNQDLSHAPENATEQVFKSDEISPGAVYFCQITNHYNGQTTTASTPFYLIQE